MFHIDKKTKKIEKQD